MATAELTKKDFVTDQEVRWCPGCGDYSILAAVQNVLPTLGIPREKFVFVSGIGCSSRFPYYMNTYGFHTIHGRAPAVATGVKLSNPDLSVWLVTGDGDALSIGGNHIIHLIRRNVDITVLMFNNRIYGLTKGQYSPTSELGKRTKSSPYGSVDHPFNPISLALGADATFVARTVDIYPKHMKEVLARAAAHRGTSFVEIYQNCNIFNDGAFKAMTDREIRNDSQVELIHGEPIIFGKDQDQGIRFHDEQLDVVRLGENGLTRDDILVHDEHRERPSRAFQLSRMELPDFPVPIGVFRS
ncbi:MAG: 2-oxoacid:ferredoxin oxidoreductase subunit beta, partial [Gemmatimonadetes bacterium]|nr:2-oxoacid:ferredoxin oxidoreductase subunit beta [Gemmatimonadota bacterium]